jgi:hypothetical protein
MLDMIQENFRKAAESTMRLQQEMIRNWSTQWLQMFGSQVFGGQMPGSGLAEQVTSAQRKWAETVTEMLNKHRETLDAQYKAGIRTIEDAFRVAEAKDPQQFRRLTEELWRQSFECLRTVVESQMRDVQSAMQKFYEVASKSTPGMKL